MLCTTVQSITWVPIPVHLDWTTKSVCNNFQVQSWLLPTRLMSEIIIFCIIAWKLSELLGKRAWQTHLIIIISADPIHPKSWKLLLYCTCRVPIFNPQPALLKWLAVVLTSVEHHANLRTSIYLSPALEYNTRNVMCYAHIGLPCISCILYSRQRRNWMGRLIFLKVNF